MNWSIRIGRAGMMGLAWAAAWVSIGVITGPILAGELEPQHIGGPLYVGLVCGAAFAAVSGFAAGRRLGDLPAYHAAAWGALSGLFTGMLPFVMGTGDSTDYQAAWAMAVVAIGSIAAGVAARQRWLGALSPSRASVLAAVLSGVPASVLLWILPGTSQKGLGWSLPLVLMAGLPALGALTGLLLPATARWLHKQNSPTSAEATVGKP